MRANMSAAKDIEWIRSGVFSEDVDTELKLRAEISVSCKSSQGDAARMYECYSRMSKELGSLWEWCQSITNKALEFGILGGLSNVR